MLRLQHWLFALGLVTASAIGARSAGAQPDGDHGGTGDRDHGDRDHGRDHGGDHGGDHPGDHADDHGGDHPGDHAGDHGGDHPGDHAGDHGGDHPGDHADDHGGDHPGDHADDHGGDHPGDHADDHHGDQGDHDRGGPGEAPPPPRPEPHENHPGQVWVDGNWDWKGGTWAWTPGHEEPQQAGKHWRAGHWDQQGDHWQFSAGAWLDDAPGAPDDRPHSPPPPPRHEDHDASQPGSVWIDGRWDWKDGQWNWTAGRWEHERPGMAWRPARWEARDGAFALVDGAWVAAGAGDHGGPDHHGDHHRHDWRVDRPAVTSFWPAKGKVGTRIVIRGTNLPADATVRWNGQPVAGARVEGDRIELTVPPGATTGELSVQPPHGRPLAVGTFEVAAGYDAAAEERRLAAQAQAQAAQAWAARQKQLAKDQAAREAALADLVRERAESREQRRDQRIAELRARWETAFLADPETQDELTLHAQRQAELQRMRDLADTMANGKLAVRVEVAQQREDQRHQARMDALHAAFGRNP
ncbi:MAG TPA: IPT/TIG domain-containing protein [Kofleriaceae bacterium]|nr:IPT/TIG domain-containing protein [Kofleriaceae bacterium]